MRKLISVIFAFIVISLSFSVAYAHPGSLDSNGGHWNHKTGEYHYHDGDNDGSNSSGSSDYTYNYTYNYYYYPNKTHSKEPPQETMALDKVTTALIVVTIVVLGLTLIILVWHFRDKAPYHWCDYVAQGLIVGKDIDEGKHILYPNSNKQGNLLIVKHGIIKKNILIANEKKIKFKKNENVFLYNCNIANFKSSAQNPEVSMHSLGNEPKEQFIKKYSGVSISSVIDVPSTISYIDKHGHIVYADKNSTYGDYTVYVSDTGRVIHRYEGCSNAFRSLNVLRLPRKYSVDFRCKRCFGALSSSLIDNNWLSIYRKIVLRKIEYNIDDILSSFNEFTYLSYDEKKYIEMQKNKKRDNDSIYIVGTDLPLSINQFIPNNQTTPSFVRIYTNKPKVFYDFIITNNTKHINYSIGTKIELVNCSIKWGD